MPSPSVSGLKLRRFWATVALLATILFVVLVIYWQLDSYSPQTRMLVVGKSADETLAMAPVRYVQDTWDDLEQLTERATHFEVDYFSKVKNYRFGGAGEGASFYSKIEDIVPELKRNDCLVIWINGTGITVDNQPMIVGDLFTSSNYASSEGKKNLVDIAEVLNAMSKWSGPKLLLIDWGQELFDPRIELLENRFASRLSEVVQKHPLPKSSPICVVTSHYDGQISLVDSTSLKRQSLFSRAVKEGLLLEPRRAPDDPQADFIVPKGASSLSTRSFVEYVVRRVSADSYGYQVPAVYLAGKGLLDKVEGGLLRDTSLVSLDSRYGRPKGFPRPIAETDDKENDASEPKKGNAPQSAPEADLPDLGAEPQPVQDLHTMWTVIEGLRAPDPKNHHWSYAALSPLAFKQIVADAMDAELRYYSQAGSKEANSSLSLQDLPPLAFSIPPKLQGNFQASERVEFENSYRTAQTNRQWACIEFDLHYLAATLSSLNLAEFNAETNQLNPLLSDSVWTDWSAGRRRWDEFIGSVIKKIKFESSRNNLGKSAAITELLLRSNLLTADQRLALRKLQETKLKLVDDESDLDKNRALTSPRSQSHPSSWGLDHSRVDESLVAQAINRNPLAVDEAIRVIGKIDPRDVRDAFSTATSNAIERILQELEYPKFRMPSEQQFWELVWDDSSIKANQFKLEGSKEIQLLLKASNPNLGFPQLNLDVSDNLAISINDMPWDAHQPLTQNLFVSSKGGKERRLLIKVVAKDSEISSGALGSLNVVAANAENISKLPESLSVVIPVDQPILLTFHQQYSKDGQLDWYEQRATLRPFSGRESKFQTRVQNVDLENHHVELRLYAIAENSRGQIGWVHRSEDIKQLLGRQPDLVWEADVPHSADPKKDAMVAKFAAPSKTEADAKTNGGAAATTPATPEATAGKLSILGGMVMLAFVDHKVEPQIFKVNFSPRPAEELLDVDVKMNRDKSLKVTARWKDGEKRDERAAIAPAPADLAAQPLSIRVDTLPWRQTNPSTQAVSIELKDDTTAAQEFTSDILEGQDKEVWLDIDGTPRALVYRATGDVDRPTKIPVTNRARVVWRSITNKIDGKPVLQYVPFKPPASKKDMSSLIAGRNAVFKDLTGTLEIELAVDLPNSNLGNADEGNNRFKVRLGRKVQENLRPRITKAELKNVGDHLAIGWYERDQVLSFDFSRDNVSEDTDYDLDVEGSELSNDLLDVVVAADLDPPELISAVVKPAVVVQGSNAAVNLSLSVKDRSSQVTVQAVAAPGKTAPPLLDMPRTGESRIDLPISTGTLLPGTYNIRVTLADAFGHVKEHPTDCSFQVQPPPKVMDNKNGGAAGAPDVVGTLKVIARLPTNRKVVNPVTFKFDPPLEKQKQKKVGDDSVQVSEVKAGSYKVTASYSESNKQYIGEETVILKKPEDFQKLWEVPIAPKQ